MGFRNLKARDLMLELDKLIFLDTEDKIALADLVMTRSSIGGLPVVRGGKLIGIITQRDIMLARNHQIGTLPVKDLMTRDIISVDPDTPLKEILKMMIVHRIERIPVVSDGKLIGLVVHGSILKALYNEF